ncbi:ADP-glyceromanno-heptose 6-epimerase [PVC group bacterium (ex Bugula neritina AB1)]|nr:ADP-glyceromanno-heptose 6-epimerase [PVC group bacterium (ex Bugula neritina AB1)]
MIVVTGGAGFIGSAVVWELNQNGEDDILIVDALHHEEQWQNLSGLRYKDFMKADSFLEKIVNQNIKNIDAIIHLGAITSTVEKDFSKLIEDNFLYSKTVISYAIDNGIRMIYASSAATYGMGERGFSDKDSEIDDLRPLNGYGYSKQMVDQWLLRHNLMDKVVGLKYFNVYGPNESHKGNMRSMVHKAVSKIMSEGKLQLFKSHRDDFKDGEQMRDFIYVKDAVKMTLHFLKKPQLSGLFNIGTGEANTWNSLAEAVFEACEKPVSIEYVDMPSNIRDQYQYFTQADIDKIMNTGYKEPLIPFKSAIRDYVQNYILKDKYLGS